MKALRLHNAQDLRLHDEPEPQPGAGETVVRVKAVGICGSDLQWFHAAGIGDARLDRPLVLGHELAGETADGIRVAIDPAIPCMECEFCLEGNVHFCKRLRFAGHGAQGGGLCESLAWPTRCLYPLPDSLSEEDGAMLEPLGVAIHAVDLGKLRPGMTIGVFGCGPIGLLIIQLARLSGTDRIIATDLLPHRLQAARDLGADISVQAATDGTEIEAVHAAAPNGLHVAFEVAGANSAVETAINAARPGGRVVLVGIPADDRTSFSASASRRKGLTILVSRRMKHAYPRAIRLVEKGAVDVRSLVTHRFLLSDYARAFQAATGRDGLKVIIQPMGLK